jgi:serine/threonine protein kinase
MDVTSHIIGNKYRLMKKIGSGKFGQVYQGTHIKKNELVAIKMEKKDQEINTIKYETTILNYLYRKGCRDTPFVLWYGIYNEYICLVMTYFEKSFMDCVPKLKSQTQQINKIMVRMIEILENIHGLYVIHRDLKPENFMILENEIYLLDFGLATIYINEKNEHNEFCGDRLFITGTPKYISINIHNGIEPSRRDDMISIGYIYLYLYHSTLPWSDCFIENTTNEINSPIHILNERNQYRKNLKEWENLEKNTIATNAGIHKYLHYCYNLKYTEMPNYTKLREYFE